MVEHAHIHQRQGIFQALGEQAIGLARFGDAGRVVMGEDQRRRVVRQGALDHLARVDAGAVDGAVEQHLEGQHPVPAVEEQAGEHLVRLVAQARLEVVAHRLRAFQRGVLA
ncbi:hypothetical protein D3C76_1252070 [compost metagenome]